MYTRGILVAGLLLFANFKTAISDNGRTILFKIISEIDLGFRNQKPSEVKFTIKANFYLSGSKNLDIPYNARFYNVTVIKNDKSNKNQYLYTCHTFNEFIKIFERPFSIKFDSFYIIDDLIFSDKETTLSKNLKFTYATFIYQIDVRKLMKKDKPQFVVYTNETNIFGYCELKYNSIKMQKSENIADYLVSKDYTNKPCLKSTRNAEDYTLGEICNADSQKEYKIKITNNRKIQLNKSVSTIQRAKITDLRSFKPWKSSPQEFQLFIRTYAKHKATVNGLLKNKLNEANSELVKSLTFTRPERSFIIGPQAKKSDFNLRDLYKALSCDASVDTTFRDFLGEAIKCEMEK